MHIELTEVSRISHLPDCVHILNTNGFLLRESTAINEPSLDLRFYTFPKHTLTTTVSWHVTLKLPLSVHYKAFSWDLIVESNGTEITKARVLDFPTTEDLFQTISNKFCK